MLIDCPACARSYHVDSDEIGAHGRNVVCPRCETQWFVDGDGRPMADALNVSTMSSRIEDTDDDEPPMPVPTRGGARVLLGVVAGIAGLMVVIGARQPIVHLVPRMERLYAAVALPVNVRGLDFAKVTSVRLADAGSQIAISGEIRNVSGRRVHVPRVAYEVRDAAGAALADWSETAPARSLGSGRSIAFISRPHDVPAAGQVVVVHFQSDDDLVPLAMNVGQRTDP